MAARLLRPVALVLLVALAAGNFPAGATSGETSDKGETSETSETSNKSEKSEKKTRSARLEGTVREADGSPAAGLSVVLTPLQANTDARMTATTNSRGGFTISPVPTGLYEIGFARAGQGYPANRLVMIPPGKKTEATFVLGPFESQDESQGLVSGQQVAGLTEPAVGVARQDEKLGPSGWAWLRTGKGVAVLVGASALVVGAVIFLTGDDDPQSVPPTTTSGTP